MPKRKPKMTRAEYLAEMKKLSDATKKRKEEERKKLKKEKEIKKKKDKLRIKKEKKRNKSYIDTMKEEEKLKINRRVDMGLYDHKEMTVEENNKFLKHWEKRRYYVKKKKQLLDERRARGEVMGSYMIYLVNNKEKVKILKRCCSNIKAFQEYERLLNENRASVSFPKRFTKQNDYEKINYTDLNYEIVLTKKVKDGESTVSHFRNENGEFVENVILNNYYNHIIIRKDDWYFEETFYVSGFNPSSSRKTYRFIYDNYINDEVNRETSRRIFLCYRSVFIQYNEDLKYITCKTVEQAAELYDKIKKDVGKNKYILFTGYLPKNQVKWLLQEIMDKTGMSKKTALKVINNHRH